MSNVVTRFNAKHMVLMGSVLVVGLITWFAWRWHDNRYPTWREEVQLLDGRIIVITQKRREYANYGSAESWVTFSLPEMGGKRTWHSYLKPMRIDVYGGKVYAIGRPRGILQYEFYGFPRHYLVAFEWNGTEFSRMPVLSVPEKIRFEENMFPCVPESRRALFNIGMKSKEWCPPSGDRWKFGKVVNLNDYEALSGFYSGLSNAKPQSN